MAPRVISIEAANPEFSALNARNPDLQRLIIGDSPTNRDAKTTNVSELSAFDTRFPDLTQLFLWKTSGLSALPKLNLHHRVLEIRDSPDLKSIANFPRSLETVVIEDCPQLVKLPLIHDPFEQITELSLAGCSAIAWEWIHKLIELCRNLKHLDLSRCHQLTVLPAKLPLHLERLELNHCTGLVDLPPVLPLTLRRVGLRGTNKLARVPHLPSKIDYVDLAFTTSLLELPALPDLVPDALHPNGYPQTLFLFGSGVLMPPASEHGTADNDNVLIDTREYQDEVKLVGKGEVNRCKLLLLGNGSAGKTYLALNLHPDYDVKTDYRGTTHGVQFWDWPDFKALKANGQEHNVNLHLWDFGGQELYHSTHRLFVNRGSIFVIVWNPDQDGRQPDATDGIQDTWYPVRYWLDYLHAECPHTRPFVAIVCSDHCQKWKPRDKEANRELKKQLGRQLRDQGNIGDDYKDRIELFPVSNENPMTTDRIPLFVVDSEESYGEKSELQLWLQRAVDRVIEAQGSVVPTYWEIAQNMVEGWLRKQTEIRKQAGAESNTTPFHAEHSRLSIAEFKDQMATAIRVQLATENTTTNFDKLRQHWNDGAFLTDRRVERTLRFLTHSGWLFWKRDLFQARVIIDQVWALEQVYACLERKPTTPGDSDSSVYARLVAAQGRFRFADLRAWANALADLNDDDQQLIMSFMESVGVCFRLSRSWRSYAEDPLYISPTHLPESDAAIEAFTARTDRTSDDVPSKHLHRGHWFAIMRQLCRIFGDEGVYTKDACLVSSRSHTNEPLWTALFGFVLDHKAQGIGGWITISTVGTKIGEQVSGLKDSIRQFFPEYRGSRSKGTSDFERILMAERPKPKTIFFSYAWGYEYENGERRETDYENAVDAIFAALKPYGEDGLGLVKLLRDKTSMTPNDRLTEFIQNAGAKDVDLVLVFSSHRYWRSWWCMAEFNAMIESLPDQEKSFEHSVLLVEHPSGPLQNEEHQKPIEEYWSSIPAQFPAVFRQKYIDKKLMADRFVELIRNHAPTITSNAIHLRKVWSAEAADEVIKWVKQKLGLPTDGDGS